MDNELFELCKEVYEITEWETERFYWSDTRNPDKYIESLRKLQIIDYKPRWLNGKDNEDKHVVPLYTSDYLLEKLPRNIGSYGLEMWSYPSDDGVAFGYYDTLAKRWHQTIPQRGDRLPLKALLKLTIALHEAGELKGNSL